MLSFGVLINAVGCGITLVLFVGKFIGSTLSMLQIFTPMCFGMLFLTFVCIFVKSIFLKQ